MTKEEHDFRKIINPLVEIELNKTQLEFVDIIEELGDKGWLYSSIENWIYKKTIERLIIENKNFHNSTRK